jgi:cobalamin biosynthetic protein CobC
MVYGYGLSLYLLLEAFLMLEHGGRLRSASAQYGIPLEKWLDLSTGINPNSFPVPNIPASLWARLPEEDDGLEQAARDYYAAESILPVAGSQAAIQVLPMLRQSCRVGVLHPGYAEHAHAWKCSGHHVSQVTTQDINDVVPKLDVLVIIHPNNPTGACFSVKQLMAWHEQLLSRDGWLVVDEAFMDATPENSLVPFSSRRGLIVLRSLGKFFGLAGSRVGFVCAQEELLEQLKNRLGPWAVNAPARWVACAALKDHMWQRATRNKLHSDGIRLHALLTQYEFAPDGGCELFQWVKTPQAVSWYDRLATQGILTRLFLEPCSLRIGLPGSEQEWQRLDITLAQMTELEFKEVIV